MNEALKGKVNLYVNKNKIYTYIMLMNTKLTLSLDKNIILQAKEYAKANKVSLSSLIENYLQKIVADHQMEAPKKGSIVSELSGIIKLDSDYDPKKDHMDYLSEKYK